MFDKGQIFKSLRKKTLQIKRKNKSLYVKITKWVVCNIVNEYLWAATGNAEFSGPWGTMKI